MKTIWLALLLLCVATPALAAPVTPQGAAELKKLTEAWLDTQSTNMKAAGMTLNRQGSVVVEEAGSYYALTTPNLSVELPGNITRTIGMVAINAIPTADPKVYKMAVALPTPIVDTDQTGNTVGNITIGTQSMSGLFNFDAQNFTELKGDYKNITLEQANGTEFTAASLSVQSALVDQGQGQWSGPLQFKAADIYFKDALNQYAIKQVQKNLTLDRADLVSLNLFRIKLQQAMLADDDKIMGVALEYLGKFAQGLDIMSQATGIEFSKALQGGKVSSGTIASANLTASLKDIKSDKSTVTLNAATQGMTFADPNSARFAPSQITLQGNGTNVPLKSLLEKAATSPDGIGYKDILGAPGSRVTMQKIQLESQAFGINGTLDTTGTAGATLGFTGNVKMDVRGLEDLAAWLSDPNGAAASGVDAQQLLPILIMMQLSGTPATDAQGRPVRNYDITFSPDGGVLMNGAPMVNPSQTQQLMNLINKGAASMPAVPQP